MQSVSRFSESSLAAFQVVMKLLMTMLAFFICSMTAQAQVFTNKTTANGLGSNYVRGVYASGSSVYAATNSGLSISSDGGTSFTNKTTANGLGSNAVLGVYASGSSVYAATTNTGGLSGGLSISTNGGTSFTNYTTANGLGSDTVRGVYASGSTV